ncbi:MAG TPA: TonB family protein [Verrucomicrobiales bacterium]|nr:TonB family protein [Verrucomicrobiales bacterium]
MNRLEKKCFFVSCILHVVFLSVLVYRSDLFAEKPVKPVKIPILNVISAEAVDALKSPGGVLEEPPKKKDPPKSKPKEPSPKPKPKPEVTKDPPKKDPPKPKKLPEKDPPKKKPSIKPNLKPSKWKPSKRSVRPSKQAPKARTSKSDEITQAMNRLKTGLKPMGTIRQVGPGSGQFANYASQVFNKYNNAWVAPANLSDSSLKVEVEVVVSRNGSVKSSRIKRGSGNSLLDQSIRTVLKRVTFIARFPKVTKDSERTFIIDFKLTADR